MSDRDDRQDIVDALTSYALALDTKDWDRLARAFTDDATADYGDLGPDLVGGPAICADLRAIVEPTDATFHLLGNFVVTVDGDRAEAQTYLFAQHVLHGATGGHLFHVTAIYHDELRRTPEGWRISARRLVPVWTDGNASIAAQARERADAG